MMGDSSDAGTDDDGGGDEVDDGGDFNDGLLMVVSLTWFRYFV